MMSESFRRLKIIFFGIAAIFSTYMAVNLLLFSLPAVSLPTSDYLSVFARYLELSEGRISIFSFILSKHIDHNHAFAYLLSLIDIILDDGRLRLLHWVQIASHIATYGLTLYVAFKLNLSIGVKSVVLIFISSQIFAIQGAETWIFPFQVVLASFRLFFVAGLFLFCRAIIGAYSSRQTKLIVSLLLLLVAALSHGSGILIFALMLGLSGIWGSRKIIFITLIFASLFVLHEIFFPPITPLVELISRIPTKQLWKTPYYLAFLLGHSFAWDAPAGFQIFVGVTGIIFWVALSLHFLRHRNQEISSSRLFFITLSTFSLAGGLMSVLLNLSYMGPRAIPAPVPLEYFLASRYLITTSGFWIGIAVAGVDRLISWKKTVLSVCLISSSGAALWSSENEKLIWGDFMEQQKMNEIVISTDAWQSLPQQALSEMLLVPTGFPFVNILNAQKQLRLGPYVPGLVEANKRYSIESAASISDANWSHGIAKQWPGLVVINSPLNKLRLVIGRKIKFSDGEVRTITKQAESGMYLNITLSGLPMNGAQIGFPRRFEVIE